MVKSDRMTIYSLSSIHRKAPDDPSSGAFVDAMLDTSYGIRMNTRRCVVPVCVVSVPRSCGRCPGRATGGRSWQPPTHQPDFVSYWIRRRCCG